MARDNSPRERQRRDLERKRASRASYDRVLIVTEGTKTEPNYFKEIRNAFRLQTANVCIHPSALGTSPLNVVEHARDLFCNGDPHRRIVARAFDRIYAVFDRDSHDSYLAALQRAEALDGTLKNDARQRVPFNAVASVPNFELWLLLHYQDVLAPIHRDDALARLRQHLPAYEKGAMDTFAITRALLPQAMARATQLAGRFSAYDEPEPYTGVAELVDFLVKLRLV